MNIGSQSRLVFGIAAVAFTAVGALAQQPPATPAAEGAKAPVAVAPEPAISTEAKAVLDRAAAAYHGCQTLQDRVDIATTFDFAGPKDAKQHMGSTKYLVFRYTAKPWRFALKGSFGCIYGDEKTFVGVNYGPRDKNGAYQPDREKAKTEYADDGTIDWRDLSGSVGRALEVDPVSALYMSGPKGGLDLFRKVTEVQPAEVDGQAGVWIRGKGPCPYTPSAAGVEITPMSAWFDKATGRLAEIRYDISNGSWAQGALETFAEKNGNPSSVKSEVVVNYKSTTVDAPIDEMLITDNKESPVENIQPPAPKVAVGSAPNGQAPKGSSPGVPMMTMGKRPGGGESSGQGTMPPMKMGGAPKPKTPSADGEKADAEKKDAAPTTSAPEVEHASDKLVNQPAPIYAGKSPDDTDFKSSDLKGKVVLMDFWATWCGPCMQAIPKIQELSEKFKGQDVVVVGINRDKPSDDVNAKVKKVLTRREITFQQVMDMDGAIVKAYKVNALPTLVVIDKEGVIRAIHVGYGPGEADMLADEISKLLKGEKLAASSKE